VPGPLSEDLRLLASCVREVFANTKAALYGIEAMPYSCASAIQFAFKGRTAQAELITHLLLADEDPILQRMAARPDPKPKLECWDEERFFNHIEVPGEFDFLEFF
jgi:hypothetical protein